MGRRPGAAVSALCGRPTVDREELTVIRQIGIREWDHWRKSLKQLGEEAWGWVIWTI